MNNDLSHIKILSVLHYVWAGMAVMIGVYFLATALWSYFYINRVVDTTLSMEAFSGLEDYPESNQYYEQAMQGFEDDAKDLFFWHLFVRGSAYLVIGLVFGALNLVAARYLAVRKGKVFCSVIAGINCLYLPLGTALGVFTFIVLGRPSVTAIFDAAENGTQTPQTQAYGQQAFAQQPQVQQQYGVNPYTQQPYGQPPQNNPYVNRPPNN